MHRAPSPAPRRVRRGASRCSKPCGRRPYLRVTAESQPAVAAHLLALDDELAAACHTVIHGDVSPKNILVGPDGPVLLDAECAVPGDPAFDLAFCVNHLLLKAAAPADHAEPCSPRRPALLDGYLDGVTGRTGWDCRGAHRAAVPALALARVDGLSPVEYLSEAHGRPAARRPSLGPDRRPAAGSRRAAPLARCRPSCS